MTRLAWAVLVAVVVLAVTVEAGDFTDILKQHQLISNMNGESEVLVTCNESNARSKCDGNRLVIGASNQRKD